MSREFLGDIYLFIQYLVRVLVYYIYYNVICNLYIPSKAYEYLWAKRPIIVITPCPIEWIKFMDEKIHSIINQDIPEQIGNCILNSVQDWENGKFVDLETQKTYSAEDAISQILKYVDLPINSESFDQKIL